MDSTVGFIALLIGGIALGTMLTGNSFLQHLKKRLGLQQKSRNDTPHHEIPESGVSDSLREKYHQTREELLVQNKILEVAKTILIGGGGTASIEETLALTLNACQQAFGGDTSVIELYDPKTNELVGVATDRKPYLRKGYFRIPLTEKSLSGLAFTGLRTVSIPDVVNDPRVSQRIRLFFDARSGIATPILIDGKPAGVLMSMMQREHKKFSLRDHSLIEGLASIAALAVQTHIVQKSRVQLEFQFKRLVDSAPTAILVLDDQFRIQEANSATESLTGLALDELMNQEFVSLFSTDAKEDVRTRISRCRTNDAITLEAFITGNSTGRKPVELTANHFQFSGIDYFQVFIRDLTAQKKAENALLDEKTRAQAALRSIADAVIITDANGVIEEVNLAAEKILGLKTTHLLGTSLKNSLSLFNPHTGSRLDDPVEKCLSTKKPVELRENVELRCDGATASIVQVSSAPIMYHDTTNPGGAVIILRDITRLQKMSDEVNFLATHDPNTGLANRAEFEQRLAVALQSAKTSKYKHSLCYIDLDRFTLINDTGGHGVGEDMLRQLIPTLRKSIREIDIFARIGGDEFALLLEYCPRDKGEEIADRLRQSVKDFVFFWDNHRYELGASIGVVEIDDNCISGKDILHSGYTACHLAKEQGRNRVRSFDANDQEHIKRAGQALWSQRIQHAIERNLLTLYEQRIIPISSTGQGPDHVEILVRMMDDQGGIILPGEFIPAAERYRQMTDLDRWVVNAALHAISQRNSSGKNDTIYNINLSGQTLSDVDMADYILERIAHYGVAPSMICFEITESAAIANITCARVFVEKLKSAGCLFALDDFGSGLSSFSYLKDLPVDFLKIDGSIVKDIIKRTSDYAMVEAINKIGHIMNIKTIAEFVSNPEIVSVLKTIGVDFGQGFGLSKPEPMKFEANNSIH